jgi:hypothetical protein
MEEVSCSDQFSEGQLLGLELAIEIRAIVLRVSDRLHARRRCQAGRCMFAIHHSHQLASAPGHMTTAKKSTNITSRSPRIAALRSAPALGPRPVRKNRLRIRKTLISIAQKYHNFGASRCSKRSLESCAEQNHLRENIGKSCEIEKSRALRF